MNKTITEFVEELCRITGRSFLYKAECWCFDHKPSLPKINYTITGMLQGFTGVTKDSEEELIASFDLIRHQIDILIKASKIQKQLDIKLLNHSDGE